VRAHPVVIAAYLGRSERAVEPAETAPSAQIAGGGE
jgi:hypothetical protein